MSWKKVINREVEVAFSKHAQPVWFRIVKYIVIISVLYFFWDSPWLWRGFAIFLLLGFVIHLWYRHKTERWTKTYGMWDYEKNKPKKTS